MSGVAIVSKKFMIVGGRWVYFDDGHGCAHFGDYIPRIRERSGGVENEGLGIWSEGFRDRTTEYQGRICLVRWCWEFPGYQVEG